MGPWRAFHKHTLPEILAAHPDENVKDATSKLREMWRALAPDEKAAWGKLAPPGDSGPGGEDDKDASIEDAGIEAADGAEEDAFAAMLRISAIYSLAVLPRSRKTLRPTRSRAWIPFVPS